MSFLRGWFAAEEEKLNSSISAKEFSADETPTVLTKAQARTAERQLLAKARLEARAERAKLEAAARNEAEYEKQVQLEILRLEAEAISRQIKDVQSSGLEIKADNRDPEARAMAYRARHADSVDVANDLGREARFLKTQAILDIPYLNKLDARKQELLNQCEVLGHELAEIEALRHSVLYKDESVESEEDRQERIYRNLRALSQTAKNNVFTDGNALNRLIKSQADPRIDNAEPERPDEIRISTYHLSSALFRAPRPALRDVKDPVRVAKENESRAPSFTSSKDIQLPAEIETVTPASPRR